MNTGQQPSIYKERDRAGASLALLNQVQILKLINPLSPHDALKHHFTSLKTDLIFLQPRVLKRKFP